MKNTRATTYGAAKYAKKIEFEFDINEELIREEEMLDGYYVLLTRKVNESDDFGVIPYYSKSVHLLFWVYLPGLS